MEKEQSANREAAVVDLNNMMKESVDWQGAKRSMKRRKDFVIERDAFLLTARLDHYVSEGAQACLEKGELSSHGLMGFKRLDPFLEG